jgi:hypothetical protein
MKNRRFQFFCAKIPIPLPSLNAYPETNTFPELDLNDALSRRRGGGVVAAEASVEAAPASKDFADMPGEGGVEMTEKGYPKTSLN